MTEPAKDEEPTAVKAPEVPPEPKIGVAGAIWAVMLSSICARRAIAFTRRAICSAS